MKLNVLFDSDRISRRIAELGREISSDYKDGKPILCLCVLRGAFMFFAELVRYINGFVKVDFITLSSYGSSSETSGKVDLVADMREDVSGKHVLIVEDIVDSGNTISFLKEYFSDKNALSVKVACLIDKPMARRVPVRADYIAFTLERPVFIVGYGLDYDQKYRNLDYIAEVDFGK